MNQENRLTMILLPQRMAVSKIHPQLKIPDWVEGDHFVSITYTQDELSIVCEENSVPSEVIAERGWRVFKVQGPLAFSMIGVIANICSALAAAGVSVFVLSTFDTDYILVKEDVLSRAMDTLRNSDYEVMENVSLSE